MKKYNLLKQSELKKKKNHKNLVSLLLVISAIGISSKIYKDQIKKNYLTKKDFQKTEWISYYNQNGRIWSTYMNENIPHNQTNWFAYKTEVEKKNSKNLGGNILLPDLDKNKKVGK